MAKKLKTFVHVVDRDDRGNELHNATFGPDDTLPEWAVKAITNPDVWADDGDEEPVEPQAAQSDSFPVVDGEVPTADRPRGNASRDTWADYASSQGVQVTHDMDRAAIIAAVGAKDKA